MANYQELINQATIVKNETGPRLNSADRVGSLFLDVINSLKGLDEGLDTRLDALAKSIIQTEDQKISELSSATDQKFTAAETKWGNDIESAFSNKLYKGRVTNPDELNSSQSIGNYFLLTTSSSKLKGNGLLTIGLDPMNNVVTQTFLSPTNPVYDKSGNITMFEPKPCVLSRRFVNGSWTPWKEQAPELVTENIKEGNKTQKEINQELASDLNDLAQKLIKLESFGSLGDGTTGITAVGQSFYARYTKQILRCIKYPFSTQKDFEVVPFEDGAIYTYDGNLYIWNGSDLEEVTNKNFPFINVNELNNRVEAYENKSVAKSAVPISKRKFGTVICYLVNNQGWITEQFIGDDLTKWATDQSAWGSIYDIKDGSIGISKLDNELINDIAKTGNIERFAGVSPIDISEDGYINANKSTVDINTINTSKGWKHIVVDCVEGDRFTVTGHGGTEPRVWCFIDANGTRLSVGDNGVDCVDFPITAPANSSKLVVNVYTIDRAYYLYRNFFGNVTQTDVYDMKKRVDGVLPLNIDKYGKINGYIDAAGKYGYIGNAQTITYMIPVNGGDGVFISAPPSGVQQYITFLRSIQFQLSNGLPADISKEDGFTQTFVQSVGDRSFKVPSDAKYLAVLKQVNGSVRLPKQIIINGYDIINDYHVANKNYGDSTGRLNSLLSKSSKLICTIIDDDGQSVESMNALQSMCEENGINVTIASLTSKWENNESLLNKLYEMEQKGHHIVLHAYDQDTVNNTWLDFDSKPLFYNDNFTRGLRMMHKAGFANCDFWVTPAGIINVGARKMAAKYGMKAMVVGVHGLNIIDEHNTISGRSTGNLEYYENTRWRIRRANLRHVDDPDWTLQDLKDLAARGVTHGAWLVLCTHSYMWVEQDEVPMADIKARFKNFIDYAKSIGYEFMTLGEAWETKRHIYDFYDSL